ncbi:hypothetical protein ETU08_06260 [Apibacter muscae]|uniref:hypothetical protein n=1 Tax=Apibacter muscae TaxID=2509004 RepID=UPI0011ADD6C8|nr:hypothetical protein [Apibacter muscae]TWP30157.1 hypothetical protein ETU08_06260 [Apibacter muscae]
MVNDMDILEKTKDYLTTLSPTDEGKYMLRVEIDGYKHLGFILLSILRVCESCLLARERNIAINTDLDICNLLDLAKSLIPYSELEFLEELNSYSKENKKDT